MLLLLALGLAALWSEKRSVTERLTHDADTAIRLFDLEFAGDVDTLQIAADPLLSDPAIIDRFRTGDREGLRTLVQSRFEALREQHGIIHMNFVNADRVAFLRVHHPGTRGDVIERVTLLEAQKTGERASGFELGVLGDPVLVVVSPLWHEGRIIGYLVLGRDVQQYTEDIGRLLGIHLHVLIRKEFLLEDKWTQGQALLGREADWERFDDFVAVGAADGGEAIDAAIDEVVPLISREGVHPERIELADGQRIAIGARPLLDAGGRQVGLLVVAMDVTASVLAFRQTLLGFLAAFVGFSGAMVLLLRRVVHRAELGLWHAEAVEHEAKVQLEERVRERTAELQVQIVEREKAEAQLRQAQKMEVIGQLTGGVAHDFNNLLAIIMGDLENLRDRLADDDLDELLAGAWEATERGTELVARLLAISRKQPLSPRPVDGNQLVEGLMPLLERAVPCGVVIEAKYAPDVWECFVDPPQLENVILNLVINGRDAMPEGGTLTIETSNLRVSPSQASEWGIEPGDYVELTVTDTGTGMTSDVLARAFDPFFTTKEVGKGSGLGLSMAHGMSKQSGGTVMLESIVGVGTTVRMLLPRARAAREHVDV